MSDGEAAHWLYRLTSVEWLNAAQNEVALSAAALSAKRRREGLTYARRGAGMAINALLSVRFDELYGRSYMDHLARATVDQAVPETVRAAAEQLLTAKMIPELVTLGPGTLEIAEAAEKILVWVATEVASATAV